MNRWEMDRGMKKVVFLVTGFICLALGTVGVILPICCLLCALVFTYL